MWQDKQTNIILPGQAETSFPLSAHVGSKIRQPTSGNFDSDFVSEASRKRKPVHLDPPRPTHDYAFPWKSDLPDDSSLLGSNRQVNSQGVYSGQPKCVGPVNFTRHYDNQVRYQNDFSEPSLFSNSHRNGMMTIANTSYNLPSQSLEPNGSMPLGNTHLPPTRETQPSHVFSQTEVRRSLPVLNASNVSSLALQGSFVTNNHVMPRAMASSDCVRPTGAMPQSFVQPSRFSDDLIGKTCLQGDYKVEISCEPKERVFCSKSGVNDFENVRKVLGSSVGSEQDDNIRLLEKKEKSRGAPSQCFIDNSESKERSVERNVAEITAEPSIEKPILAVGGNTSSESRSSLDNTTDQGQKNNPTCGHLKSDENNRLPSEKSACNHTEKLWDGSLQLSATVTMSAVAFFKSGEKMHDINWPQSVEVKGKVRLEAFEKYIQDLPRSRNRGLMVISLCWKEGTSVTGLIGLKEVARGYKKTARVGRAQLSSGTDLYICPRSDTIITILAKYGFFKGIGVSDDNFDSLIGCVVWKKNNRPPSNPVGENIESKSSSSSNQPQVSVPMMEFSPIRQTQESSHLNQAASTPSTAGTERNHTDSSFLSNPSALPISIPPVPVGQQTPDNSYSPLVNSDPPCPNNPLKKPVLPSQDDDDLPEYDFGVACGISKPSVSKPLEPAQPGSSENSSLLRIQAATNQTSHPSESKLHVSISEEKPNKNEVLSHEQLSKKKNIFDDDDMPEWCPPEHHSQSKTETIRVPITKNLPPRPLLPCIRPPNPTDTRSVFSYQPFNQAFSSPPRSNSIKPPQPLPLQSGQSSVGLTRPAIRPEFQFSDRRRNMP